MDTLTPVLESTEKCVRIDYVPVIKLKDETVHSSISKKLHLLEKSSLSVWNVVDLKMKECEKESYSWKDGFYTIVMKLKYFVCLLLSIYTMMNVGNLGKIGTLKCLFRTYYECIDLKDLNVGKQVKEYVEKIIPFIETCNLNDEDEKILNGLKVEFLILDMQSAFLLNNISMAKFYENKANVVDNCVKMKVENVFNICRILFNDGLQLYQQGKYHDSYYFLERCYLVIEKMVDEIKESGPEYKIKVSTLTILTKCCIKLDTKESIEKANKLIKFLQMQETEKVESFKLQLELLEYQSLNVSEIEEIMMKFIISLPSNLKILQKIRMLLNSYSSKQPTIAKNCLLYVFTNKLKFSDTEYNEVIENYLISSIWMVTSQLKIESTKEKLNIVENILEIGDKKIVFELTKETKNCLVILLWSMGKKKMKEEDYNEALEWFECCFSRILKVNNDQSEQNDEIFGKIERSMLQCCLKVEELDKFNNIFNRLSKFNKKNAITLYYKFVQTLKMENQKDDSNGEAIKILTELCDSEDPKSINLLALCVIESKDNTNGHNKEVNKPLNCAIEKMLTKCDAMGTTTDNPLFLVALRSSVYIYGKTIDNDIKNCDESVDMMIKSINQFIKYAKENESKIDYSEMQNDCEWFASICYNYGVLLVENEIFDINGVKLFSSVIRLIKLLKKENQENYYKWQSKAIIFSGICERKIIEGYDKFDTSMHDINQKWKKIYDDNIQQIAVLSEYEDIDREIIFQHHLIINESLIRRKLWKDVIKRVKQLTVSVEEDFVDIEMNNEQLDNLMEMVYNKSQRNFTSVDYDQIAMLSDTIMFERGFKEEFQVSERMIFKWIYLLVNYSLLEEKYFQQKVIDYILTFQKKIEDTRKMVDHNEDNQVKDSELEWLAGVLWNKGIENFAQERPDEVNNMSMLSADDSGYDMNDVINEEPSSKRLKLSNNNNYNSVDGSSFSGGDVYCDAAIAISGVCQCHVQRDRMVEMRKRLI